MAESRILLMIESGGPGGAERLVLALATAHHAAGRSVAVLTFREGWLTQSLDDAGIRRFLMPSHGRLDLGLPQRIADLIRSEGFNCLHSHLLDSNFYGALAARLAGVPHLATEHGDVHHTQQKKFLRLKLWLICRLTRSLFVAVSRFTARHLETLGVPAARIKVIYNPALLPDSPDPISRSEARSLIGAAESDFLWLTVANLRPVKNQALLLNAFKAALVREPEQLLLIAGDGSERAALERQTATLGITERVKFLGFQRDTARWYRAADGFVLSSLSESLPMSLLEASAAGLPLLATNVGGISEIITPEENGLLVESEDAAELAAALQRLATDRALAARLGRSARTRAEQKFSLSAAIQNYL